MHTIKNFKLCLTIIIINHLSFSQQNPNNQIPQSAYIYNKNIDHQDPAAAERLTQESFISPEMQWEILSMLDQKSMTINRFTGDVQGILSIEKLLEIINKKIQYQISSEQKNIFKNGLRTMLEATDIAIFVANTEACLKDPNFVFYQTVNSTLLTNLRSQKQIIESMIATVNAIQVGEQSSYFSWLWSSSDTNKKQYQINSHLTVNINPQSSLITIPQELVTVIIQNNDYKQKSDPVQAANLLFKECFIAQQHHLKDLNRIEQIRINLENPISAHNYIYTNFPDFYEICNIAKNLVPANQYRSDLRAAITKEQRLAHELLLHIRQAIQTALYISNKKSDINLGYLLPQSVKSYLDATLKLLLEYDVQLSVLCKDPRYGATLQDTYKDEQWSTITKVAAGAALTALVGGSIYTYAPTVLHYATNWWNSTTPTPAQKPLPEEEKVLPQSWYDYAGSKITYENTLNAAQFIGETGKQIAAAGGLASQIGSSIAQSNNEHAAIGKQLQQYGQYAGVGGTVVGGLTGNYKDVATAVGAGSSLFDGKIGAAGSAIGASIGAFGAIANAKDAYEKQGTLDSIEASWKAYQSAQHALNTSLHAYNTIQKENSTNNNVTIKILTPQEIYNACINIIQQTVATGGDILTQLSKFITYLFENKMATPPLVSDILQKLPQEIVANPIVAQPVNQIVQTLNEISQQNLKTQSTAMAG